MKKKLFISLLILITLPIQGQKVAIESVVVGKKETTGNDIKGKKYSFGKNINAFYFDSIQKNFILHLVGVNRRRVHEKTSQLIQYDWTTNQVKWSQKLESALAEVYEGCLFLRKHNGFEEEWTRLDLNTGKPMWHFKNCFAFLDTAKKMVIFCEVNLDFEDRPYRLTGVDLRTGEKKWVTTLKFPFGLQFPQKDFLQRERNLPYLNDSTILVLADGLQTINLNTGTGWHYKVETGRKLEPKNPIRVNGVRASGIGLTFQRSYGYTYPLDYDAITALHSNLIQDTTTHRLYFASKDKLTCLNYQGQEIWTYPFPHNCGSTSKLVLQDSFLYWVNLGYASLQLSKIHYGRAFAMAFNKTDGAKKWITTFQEKEMIEDIILKTNGLYLLFRDKISLYSLEKGHFIQTEKLPWNPLPSFSSFLNYPVEERITENQFQSMDIRDTTKHYINMLGNLGVLDPHFKLERTIPNLDCYTPFQLSDYHFIANINNVMMFNKKNQRVARLKYSPQYYFKGSFYVREENQIIEIKLKDILD